MNLPLMFGTVKPVIAMVHLRPLPGQPGFTDVDVAYAQAFRDVSILQNAGFNGLLFENWYEDSPSAWTDLKTSGAMTEIILRLTPHVQIPFGINVLNNDYRAAFQMAKRTSAAFVQMDVLVDRVRSDFIYSQSGKNHPFEIDVDIQDVAKERKRSEQSITPLFAFIQPKHYSMLEKNKTIEKSAHQAIIAGVQAILLTKKTGLAPSVDLIIKAKHAVGGSAWVGIGSGFSYENAATFLPYIDFAVVGTDVKVNRILGNSVDETRAMRLMKLVKKYQTATKSRGNE